MKHSLPIAALLLLLPTSAAPAIAGEPVEVASLPASAVPEASGAAIEAWAARLGSPAREDALEGLPHLPRALEATDAVRVVRALEAAGGIEAAVALRELATHRDSRVRAAAIDVAGDIALRTRGTTIAVRVGLSAREAQVRTAALRAIGRIGDARDVPGLMAGLVHDDVDIRAAALAALRGITGVRLSACAQTWDRWWILSRKVVKDRLCAALDGLECETGSAACVASVARYAWVDLEGVENEMRVWLRSSDSGRRAAAARVVAEARLGDLAGDVQSVLRYTDDPALFDVVHESARVLGVSTAGVIPPAGALATLAAGR